MSCFDTGGELWFGCWGCVIVGFCGLYVYTWVWWVVQICDLGVVCCLGLSWVGFIFGIAFNVSGLSVFVACFAGCLI